MSDYEKHIGTIEKVNFDGTVELFQQELESSDFFEEM